MTNQPAGSASRVPFARLSFSFEKSLISLSQISRRGLALMCGVVSFVAALMMTGAVGAAAQAPTLQGGWTQLSPGTPPPARFAPSLAYDSAHAQVVMFGGFGYSNILNDTWLWNGTNWTNVTASTITSTNTPPARSNQTMVYDAAQGAVVMFGGATGAQASSRLGDTWLWNGTANNWTQGTGLSSTPPARSSAAMAYDAATGQVVLLGGLGGASTGGADLGDTWVWYENNWYSEAPSNSPSARYGASMAYDAALGEVILFGGFDQSGNEDTDTWAWNGSNWTQLSPSGSPAGRDSAGMEYDPLLGQVVLFGGQQQIFNGTTYVTTYLGDTWVLTGNSPGNLTWTPQTYSTSPAVRSTSPMVYDAAQGQVVMFGGYGTSGQLGDTWNWGTAQGFGNINVCPSGQSNPAPCSNTLTLTYNVTTTTDFGTPVVVTQGAQGLDFSLASGSTCTGTVTAPGTCTVNVTFAPQAPGLRQGAVQLFSSANSTTPLATTPIYGIGAAPLAAFSPLMTFVQNSFSLSSPDGVAVDAAGDIFVANGGGGDVLKLAAGSNSASTVGYQPNNPASVAIDGAGDVYIGQYGPTVLEVPAGCTQAQIQTCQKSLGGFGEAPAIAVDAAGDIFVGDQYNREVFEIPVSNQGTQTVVYNPNDSSFLPQGLAVDLAGDLFIADYPEHKVLELPPGGSIPTTVGFGWNSPQSVTLDAAGDLYVADSGLREVVEIPAGCNGASCQLIVASATDLSLGSNFGPYGVALDSLGNVYIADVGLNRVDTILQQFAGLPFSESTVANVSGDSPKSITLQNIGNQALNATPSWPAFTNPAFYEVPGSGTPPDCNTTFSLTQGADCNLSISFDPLTSGLETGNSPFTLTGSALFEDNSLNSASGQAVSLSGTSLANGTTGAEYLLTVSEGGSGSGSVTDNMSAISCSESSGSVTGSCSGNYASGAQVTLTANASGGSTFISWGGACTSAGTYPTCVVTMSQALNVSASFAPQANFATANVCSGGNPSGCTSSFQVTFTPTSTVTGASVQVVTQGAPGLDFTLDGSTCTGDVLGGNSCTATVSFTPLAPGLRMGAVELSGVVNGTGGVVNTIPIYGIGKAPETAFGPAMTGTYPSVIYSSQVNPVANLTGYSGITTDASGNLYHLTGPSLLAIAPPHNGTPTTVATCFHASYSVAIDGAGNFYIADPEINTYGEVVKLAPGCTSATASCASVIYAPSSHPGPIAVAVDGTGNVFIAQNLTGVFEIPANGGPQFTLYNPPGNSLDRKST